MVEHPTAFISYSWDNEEHKKWVVNLANDLRENGVDATLDQFEIHSRTVNINEMMVAGFRNYDYVILVLTEKYAEKAEKRIGGVGFETLLSYSVLKDNQDKLILITRGDMEKVFPFHLKGFYAIDFSNDLNYDTSLAELIYRIYNKPLIEKKPLGGLPDFKSIDVVSNKQSLNVNEIIPDLNEYTDIDKIRYIEKSFREIADKLNYLLEMTRASNTNFDFTREKITSRKEIFRLFKDGKYVTGVKIWLNNSWGSAVDNICFSFGRITSNDNSMNEQVQCVIDNNQLKLKVTLNSFKYNKPLNTDELVQAIWQDQIYSSLIR